MPYLSGVRDQVADVFTGAVPGLSVLSWPEVADQPMDPCLVIVATGVTAPTVASHGALTAQVELWAVVPFTTDQGSEDALDELLDDVLSAADLAGLVWTRAERAVWRETHPAYRIEIEVRT